MSDRDRGLSVAQAKQLAGNPTTAPGVLTRLANGYPEVWQILLDNQNTPTELRDWLRNALKPKPVVAPVFPTKSSGTDETLVVERIPNSPRVGSGTDSRKASRSSGSESSARETVRAPRRRLRRRAARGGILTILLSLVTVGALGVTAAVAIGSAPEAGLVTTQELSAEPTFDGTWSYDLVQGQGNTDCIEWSFQALSQDLVVILSQYSSSNDGCSDLEEKPETFLALVNTVTGVESWRVNVGDTLSWSTDWSKDLGAFTGLNEIIVKFTEDAGPDEEDPLQTLVPFNRLDGSVTDAVVARSESDPVLTAPHIEVGRVPWSDRDIVVGFPASGDDRRLSLRRAKSLTEDKWNVTTELEPVSGNPVVDRVLILGSKYDDEPKAVNLETGAERIWNGPAGGKIFKIAGNYVHVQGDGTKERVSNSQSQGGKAETDDCDAECITLTGFSTTGQTLWQKKVPGYALTRNPETLTNATRGEYTQLFITDNDRNSATRINPTTGEPTWTEAQDWGDFEISKVSGTDVFFTFQKTGDSDHRDKMQMRSMTTGSVLGEYEIPNDDTRIDAISANFAYLIDEPNRASAVDDVEAGDSVTTDANDDEDSDPAKEKRICATGINLVTRATSWEWTCNGYQHILLAAGNWVVFDKAPGEQVMRGLRVSP